MDMQKIKQTLRPGFWGAVVGASAMAFVGFNWGGWVTGGSAKEMVATAVTDRLIPICVGQFDQDPARDVKLAKMKNGEYWRRAEFVELQGWATMPGSEKADSEVATGCAKKIMS